MSEMIDRCAGALYAAIRKGMHESAGAKIPYWDNLPKDVKDEFRRQVRAVLQAAREPTKEMISAAWLKEDSPFDEIWNAMIDEALK